MNILFIQVAHSYDECPENCTELVRLTLTSKGLSHILESILNNQFTSLNKEIKNRSGFRTIVFDQSQCPEKTLKQAMADAKKNIDVCWGIPDLTDKNFVSGSTKLKPFKAEINNFDLKNLQLKLDSPLDCEGFKCKFKIKISQLSLSGEAKIDYTNPSQNFIPQTPFNLSTTNQPDISLTVEASINPNSGELDNLIFLNEKATSLNMKAGSLALEMNLIKPYPSPAIEAQLKGKYYRQKTAALASQLKSRDYVKSQIQASLDKLAFQKWSRDHSKNASLEKAMQQAKEEVTQQYGSLTELENQLLQISWPSDDQQIKNFMDKPPEAVKWLPQMQETMMAASIGATAENAGFKNQQGFEWAVLANEAAKQTLGDNFLIKEALLPALLQEINPAIQSEVNKELRQLKNHWNKISAYPSLNLQNLADLSRLESAYENATTNAEKTSIKKQLDRLRDKMSQDWLAVSTDLTFAPIAQTGNLLKGTIRSGSNPNCSLYPKIEAEKSDSSADYDLRTEVGGPLFQDYLNKMAENKKLNVCFNSDDPVKCTGGQSIKFNSAPQISCQNGKFILKLDTEARQNLIAGNVGVDVDTQFSAELTQCGDHACFRFRDTKGRLKNAYLNTFLGGFVQSAVSKAVYRSSSVSIKIPKTTLKDYQTDPTTCQSKLDWLITP